MKHLHLATGVEVPIEEAVGGNLWTYSGFELTEVGEDRHDLGTCRLCLKPIVYNYLVSHPQYGKVSVGMECIREVLPDEAIHLAMSEFRKSKSAIDQHRFKSRIERIVRRIPAGALSVWTLDWEGSPVKVHEVLNKLQDKLQTHMFLSRKDIQMLQLIESYLKL